MKSMPSKLAAVVFALALAAIPLAACSGQQSSDAGQSDVSDVDASSTNDTAEAAPVDISSLTTIGDALAVATEQPSFSFNEQWLVCTFGAGGSVIRATVELQPGDREALQSIDFMAADLAAELTNVVGDRPLASIEDLAPNIIPQEELDAFVGKTGQDLLDAGFTFSGYFYYGGIETGATYDKGFLSYNIMFKAIVDESQADDGGAALAGATITSLEYTGASSSSVDPESVQ